MGGHIQIRAILQDIVPLVEAGLMQLTQIVRIRESTVLPLLKIAVAARFVLTPSIPLSKNWRGGRSPDQGERMVFSFLCGGATAAWLALLKIDFGSRDTALPCPGGFGNLPLRPIAHGTGSSGFSSLLVSAVHENSSQPRKPISVIKWLCASNPRRHLPNPDKWNSCSKPNQYYN
jgi:hypothetical protein